MLKGWTLTDLHCETCRITPLMREPAAQAAAESRDPIQFCALCDRQPATPAPIAPTTTSAPSSSRSTTLVLGAGAAKSSSPIPESGSVPSSHDDAANKISSLLLQGYSLLGTNCPKSTCRGIPLVGYPRGKDGKKDSRRLCVSCGSRWIDEGDAKGLKLVGQEKPSTDKGKGKEVDSGPESPRTKRRNELYGLTSSPEVPKEDLAITQEDLASPAPSEEQNPAVSVQASLQPSFEKASASLALTLDRLASSLERHTVGTDKEDEARYFVDVKLHTDAMKDVLQVMGMMQGLKQ